MKERESPSGVVVRKQAQTEHIHGPLQLSGRLTPMIVRAVRLAPAPFVRQTRLGVVRSRTVQLSCH